MPSGVRLTSRLFLCQRCGVEFECWSNRGAKWCEACREVIRKEAIESWRRANRPYVNSLSRARNKANPEMRRRHWLDHNYGPGTAALREVLFLEQEGCCKICGLHEREVPKKVLCVDHDSSTGAVRALLCHNCNVAIGLLKHDPDRLLAAAVYLMAFASDEDV